MCSSTKPTLQVSQQRRKHSRAQLIAIGFVSEIHSTLLSSSLHKFMDAIKCLARKACYPVDKPQSCSGRSVVTCMSKPPVASRGF